MLACKPSSSRQTRMPWPPQAITVVNKRDLGLLWPQLHHPHILNHTQPSPMEAVLTIEQNWKPHTKMQKKLDTTIAMQTILGNQFIDAIPDDYFAKFWDPNKGYNQSTFKVIIFHIFDQYFSSPTSSLMTTKSSLTNQYTSTNHWSSTSKSNRTVYLL